MDAGVVSGLLQFATQGDLTREEVFALSRRREQKARHHKWLRRRGGVFGVGAPLRCASASPSSRLLASDPAALATPPHTLFQQPASLGTMSQTSRPRLLAIGGILLLAAAFRLGRREEAAEAAVPDIALQPLATGLGSITSITNA